MTPNPLDLEGLRRLAEATAASGWWFEDEDQIWGADPEDEYIRAANPQTILALLDALAERQAEVASLKREVSRYWSKLQAADDSLASAAEFWHDEQQKEMTRADAAEARLAEVTAERNALRTEMDGAHAGGDDA